MICVDASLVVKWVLTEEFSNLADQLAESAFEQNVPMVAPPLLPAEVLNTLRQIMIRHSMTLGGALRLFRGFSMYPIYLIAPDGMFEDALEIAERFALPAAYDAQYLALSENLDCAFWTADERLIRRLDGRLPFVRWIGDYKAGEPL